MSSPTLTTDLQHPVLTTQICFDAKNPIEPSYFPPENVETSHRQGKAPCRHACVAITPDCVTGFLTSYFSHITLPWVHLWKQWQKAEMGRKRSLVVTDSLNCEETQVTPQSTDSTPFPAMLQPSLEVIPAPWSWVVSGSIHSKDALEAILN